MIIELQEFRKYLELNYNDSRVKKSIHFHKLKNEFKYIWETIDSELQKMTGQPKSIATQFVDYVRNKRKYLVIFKDHLSLRLINTEFTLLVQIALAQNELIQIPSARFVLEIHYLVSVKNGLGVGSKFLDDFVKFSDEINLPLVLYCEKSLTDFYNKHGFTENGYNYQGNYLMVHYPLKNS